MFAKVLPAVCLAAAIAAAPALAQLSEPAELPPEGYQGQQYVDSRGCVFLRAGYGGQVTWVPRVTRDRKQLCGYPPSDVAGIAPPPSAPANPAVAVADPAPTAAPAVKPASKARAKAKIKSKPAHGGGLQILVDGAPVGHAAWEADAAVPAPAAEDRIAPPPGYKPAWKDGRLNPNRGRQTVQGVYDQDEVWTRTVPAELREDWPKPKAPLKVVVRHRDGTSVEYEGVVVSTKSDGRRAVRLSTATGVGPFLVQVGTYGVPSNAAGAEGRLSGLGLPVAHGPRRGGALTVVYAGPFETEAEARAALASVRKAGFADAIILD